MVYGSPFMLSTHPTPLTATSTQGSSPRNYNTLSAPPLQSLSSGEAMQLMLSMRLFLSTVPVFVASTMHLCPCATNLVLITRFLVVPLRCMAIWGYPIY